MSVSLQKGQKVNLSKDNAGLAKVIVGLGWDEAKPSGGGGGGFFATLFGGGAATTHQAIDCDASAIMLKNGKFVDRTDLVYFGNLKHKSGTVNHMGDNLTGEGEGDDEQIVIDLSRVPAEYDKIVIVVNIYQAVQRKQHFGMIENAFIRLVDARNNKEMCKYNLTENYSGMTAMIFGEIYRHNGEWKFNAMGNGTTDPGIGELCRRFS
ncbi:TerD family protein [Ruminococcus sp. AF37-6AT]|jgi:stress response protein SCP2|nr:TerD family protein [Ruminococcus sp. TM10-9AT]RHD96431.1 TerD family protein [Ruminococcus sp. AM30-15AC]RHG53766.1 TerD family protein [Ruminococcus sp. AM22-13]RHL48723.1 TerD family protein [Ruminococcus sp. AF37-6AT]RHP53672.1 TerD family protein [Ruminococcus sp. AF31-16BH]RHQ67105.1 TerD family protein [Ruminococcus sp. AF24-32LB]RHQ92811.1 TerD family protein [Ruminococcus sp. AF21-3]